MGIEPWKTQTATEVGPHYHRKNRGTRCPILKENLHSVLTEDRLWRKNIKVCPTVHPRSCLANLRSSAIFPQLKPSVTALVPLLCT